MNSARRRKVLWLIDSLALGGAERLAVDFALHAERERVQVRVATLHPAAQLAAGDGADALEVRLRENGLSWDGLNARHLRDRAAFARLRGVLRSYQPDVIHAHLRYASVWASAAGRLESIPAVATVHVLPGNTGRRDTGAAASGWARRVTAVRDRTLARLELHALNHWASRVIAISQAQAAAWKSAGLRADHTTIIPNGVEPIAALPLAERNAVRGALGAAPGDFVFVSVAVVRRPKGWATLLEAVPRILQFHPSARFTWIGDGPDMPALRAAVEQRGLGERVRLMGRRADVPLWLCAADAFLFPSLEEALPTALIEAMAANLPIVASDIPAIAEVLADAGVLVPPGNAALLAEAACHMIASRELRFDCAQRGQRRFRGQYAAETWRARLADLYDEMAGASRRSFVTPLKGLRAGGGADSELTLRATEMSPFGLREASGPEIREQPALFGLQKTSTPRRAHGVAPLSLAEARRATGSAAMRVLAVEFFSVGGLFHYTAQLCQGMARAGAQVSLLTGRNPEFPLTGFVNETLGKTTACGASHAANRVELLPRLRTWNPRRNTPRWLRKAERYLHGVQYAGAWLQVLAAARRLRPDVILFGDFEHRCDAWFVRRLQRSGFRVADIWHNVEAFERSSRDASVVIRHERWRDALARDLDVLFVHGEALVRQLYDKTGRQAVAIPHGDEGLMAAHAGPDPDLDRRFALPPGVPLALLFGTITKYKGVPLLIEALAALPEAARPVVLVAGFATDDTDIDALKRQAADARVERWLRWDMRYVPLDEVAWYFRRADFVVLPYRAASQSGVAHLALTFSTPLVVTDVGALAEATGGGRAGLIVPPDDADALAAALERITADGDLRLALAAEAGRLAAERGDWDAIAARVLETLQIQLKEASVLCAESVDTSAAA